MSDRKIVQDVTRRLRAEFGDDLVGILAGGSRLRGEGDANSDIDVVVVVGRPARQRRNIVVDGVEVEMFFNPAFQMQRYFKEEAADGRAVMPHLCASGEIVHDPHGTMAKLQAQARAICEAGPPPLSAFESWSFRYHAADALRDIDDVAGRDGVTAALLVGRLVPQLLDHHYRICGRWIPKRKRILADLAGWDQAAAKLARSAGAEHATAAARRDAAYALARHVLAPLGGLMPLAWSNEWQALSPDTAPDAA